jgi:hypothetical protein
MIRAPNRVACNDKHYKTDLDERLENSACVWHHWIEVHVEVPVNVEMAPALLAEGAGKEEVKCGFFPVHGAQRAIVVVSFKFLFFPF